MYMASKRRLRRRVARPAPSGWRGVAHRILRRPAAVLLVIALVVAVAVSPSVLSVAGLAVVLAYQATRAALPRPGAAWPPR